MQFGNFTVKCLLWFCVLLFSFSSGIFADDFDLKQGELLYSWINDLRVRDENGKTVTRLQEFETVIYLGQHSEEKRKLSLRGKKLNDYNYLVKTNTGISGWVYGGALKQVTGIKPDYSEAAQACFNKSQFDLNPGKLITKRQKVINGAEIHAYIESLEKGDLVYKKPRFKSGCLGTLQEICFANNQLKNEHEGGASYILFGDFKPVLGISKGTSKDAVLESLGQPRRQNDNTFIYQSFFYLQQENHGVTIDYFVTLFFDPAGNVDTVKISSNYHEDC